MLAECAVLSEEALVLVPKHLSFEGKRCITARYKFKAGPSSLFGFQLLAPGFKHDNAKLGFNELQRERYPRGTGADDAQITFQLRVGRNRPIGGPLKPDCASTVFHRGVRGCDRGGEPRNPLISRFSERLPMARRRARPAGRIEEAKCALEKAIAIAPAGFGMYVRRRVPWIRPEDYAHMLEGLRKAGWRET
jgi:hypothetical protein